MAKMTKKDYFRALLTMDSVKSDPAMVAFIEHEIDLLERKNSTPAKPTKQQAANAELKQSILASMEDNRLYTISEMNKEFACCAGLSGQRISAVVRQMVVNDGTVERIEEKRRAYFRIIR